MKLGLFYDTETSGFPLFSEPSSDPRQPHIVQLAAKLIDLETQAVYQAIDVICRPDITWSIPKEASDVHGITQDLALEVGIAERDALSMLLGMKERAAVRIAHNEQFDTRILRIACKRFIGDEAADGWVAGDTECTMRLATPILNLPPTDKMRRAGRNHPKSANLSEAYKHFTGNDLENAHSAMADVDGCIAVYFAIQQYHGQEAPSLPLDDGNVPL